MSNDGQLRMSHEPHIPELYINTYTFNGNLVQIPQYLKRLSLSRVHRPTQSHPITRSHYHSPGLSAQTVITAPPAPQAAKQPHLFLTPHSAPHNHPIDPSSITAMDTLHTRAMEALRALLLELKHRLFRIFLRPPPAPHHAVYNAPLASIAAEIAYYDTLYPPIPGTGAAILPGVPEAPYVYPHEYPPGAAVGYCTPGGWRRRLKEEEEPVKWEKGDWGLPEGEASKRRDKGKGRAVDKGKGKAVDKGKGKAKETQKQPRRKLTKLPKFVQRLKNNDDQKAKDEKEKREHELANGSGSGTVRENGNGGAAERTQARQSPVVTTVHVLTATSGIC
ncbi:hypothetical protein EDC01DRAFT_462023 [Geopyxis carbonaria]|nr:hypothetical protein EDC01DRAFT_462023 [Geopyxis carbonaria]